MYIIFDGEGFKTIGDEQDVKELLQQCEHGTEPYTIYASDLDPHCINRTCYDSNRIHCYERLYLGGR